MFRCDVCTEAWESLFAFFCQEPNALMGGANVLEALRDSHGFCAFHTWMLTRYASPRNLSQAFPTLLEDVSAGLLALAGKDGWQAAAQIQQMLGTPRLCPACRVIGEAEDGAVRRVRERVLSGAEERTPSLCLRHLAEVTSGLNASQAAILIRAHATWESDLAGALRGYAAKFDALRRNLMTEEERNAYREALVFLTGERDLAGPSSWVSQPSDSGMGPG
jgi:hypothetical protein